MTDAIPLYLLLDERECQVVERFLEGARWATPTHRAIIIRKLEEMLANGEPVPYPDQSRCFMASTVQYAIDRLRDLGA